MNVGCVWGGLEQIPNPGDYFVQQIGMESLIITKTRQGEVCAFYNVCRHRGARLCSQGVRVISASPFSAPITPGRIVWLGNSLARRI